MARYAVTGGAGFIGSNIVERLLVEGHTVVVVDNLQTGRECNLEGLTGDLSFERMDICETDRLKTLFKGVEGVFHQAALPSVPRSVDNPEESNRNNVNGTLSVLLAARESGVKRVVYASSSSVYGESEELPKREAMAPAPLSPYAIGKLTGEYYCRVFYSLYGLETVALRYFNVFGPKQDPASEYAAVMPKFITWMNDGVRPRVYGDGEQTRDFTYVGNVVAANWLAMTTPGVGGLVANVACGSQTSLNELVAILNRLLGRSLEPEHVAPRPGEIKHSYADISLAQSRLKFTPQINLEDGLGKSIRYYLENRS